MQLISVVVLNNDLLLLPSWPSLVVDGFMSNCWWLSDWVSRRLCERTMHDVESWIMNQSNDAVMKIWCLLTAQKHHMSCQKVGIQGCHWHVPHNWLLATLLNQWKCSHCEQSCFALVFHHCNCPKSQWEECQKFFFFVHMHACMSACMSHQGYVAGVTCQITVATCENFDVDAHIISFAKLCKPKTRKHVCTCCRHEGSNQTILFAPTSAWHVKNVKWMSRRRQELTMRLPFLLFLSFKTSQMSLNWMLICSWPSKLALSQLHVVSTDNSEVGHRWVLLWMLGDLLA